MTNKEQLELIAQARELCEKKIDEIQGRLALLLQRDCWGGVMGTENWGDVESIIQSLAVYGYEPLPKDDVVSRYQWLKKISEVTESEKIAFMKEHSTTVLWDASGRAIHALARLADVFFNEASTLREQIAREIEADPDATHISIKLAAAIARGEK